MTTLRERLESAMESTTPATTQAAIAKACRISTAAVHGWFQKPTFALQATHCFALAKLMQVDPEWLATGRGQMTPGGLKQGTAEDAADQQLIESARADAPTLASFMSDYRKLTSIEKTMVRTVVVALARSHDPVYQAYEKSQRANNHTRDGKPQNVDR